MPINQQYLIPGAMPVLAPFEAHRDLAENFSKNKNPMFALNPFQKGSVANAMDSFTPHGQIMRGLGIGGKGGQQGSAYATGEFDVPSFQARQDIQDFMRSSEENQRKDFESSIARGIENRKAAKEQENKAIFGPKLDATEVNKVPGFLASMAPKFASGADRGTLYGKALENAMREGKTSVDKMDEGIGAKGSATGLRNEAIPQFQAQQRFDPLTPANILHAGAANMVQGMNNKKGGK